MNTSHAEPDYMKIFWGLLLLTILEVAVVYLHIVRWALVSSLIIMALMKAFLVAWNYMHLRFEKSTLIATVAFPLLLLVILLLGLMPDIGKIPF